MENKNTKNPSDYIYGRNALTEALSTCANRINKILISKNTANDVKINEIINLAKANGVVFQFVPKERFANFANIAHQGVVAKIISLGFLTERGIFFLFFSKSSIKSLKAPTPSSIWAKLP